MNTTLFSDKIREILAFPGMIHDRFSSIDLIVNPIAGAFQKKGLFLSRVHELSDCLAGHTDSGLRGTYPDPEIHVTEYHGHANGIMRSIIARVRSMPGRALVITAGGDGTHLEVLSSLIEADEDARSKICIFRLPMGTGNDSADAESLAEACSVLSGVFTLARTGAVRFSPNGMKPLYAFNIGGLGLDAFVVILKNSLRKLPGNIYRIMVDVATLAYEPLFGAREMHATLMSGDTVTGTLTDRFLMFVIGLSGFRTYGDHLHILPTEDNICTVRKVGLFRKLEIKKRFYAGSHIELPEVTMAQSDSIVIEYPGRIPLQVDGEAVVLKKENFPLRVDILPPCITVLHPDRQEPLAGRPELTERINRSRTEP